MAVVVVVAAAVGAGVGTKRHRRTDSPLADGNCLEVDVSCEPLGFNVAYYYNNFGAYSNPSSGVTSNYYIVDNLEPLNTSLTNITQFPQDSTIGMAGFYPNASLPLLPYYPDYQRETNGELTVSGNNFTLVYYGLYKARSTGVYELYSSADNEIDIYFGDGNAYSCATGEPNMAQPLVKSFGGNDNNAVNCTTLNLVKGLYYPIRSVMGNCQGASALTLSIVAPGDSQSADNFTGYAYHFSCGKYS